MKKCQGCNQELENKKNRFCRVCIEKLKRKMEATGYLQEIPRTVVGQNRGQKCFSSVRLSYSDELMIDTSER